MPATHLPHAVSGSLLLLLFLFFLLSPRVEPGLNAHLSLPLPLSFLQSVITSVTPVIFLPGGVLRYIRPPPCSLESPPVLHQSSARPPRPPKPQSP
ncbi:hypothetical protein E2C01_051479 [Portunus trituberculatus]|uniref:Uncharacterized protein n=1 Tax=Portunus trituberculatus TaxID=210409 RepID=A0A5B7GKG0_PORTR|nr:hypothetical protein [Portunus trituberculatus]